MAGMVPVPPIRRVAPFAIEMVPPATVVPLLAVKEEISSIPAFTTIIPAALVLEFMALRLPASVFTSAPLMRKVE